jgi:hypothetical protein
MRNIYQPITLTLLLAFTCVSLSSLAQTQTGPGGVGTSSNLHVWLDASQLTLSNGDPVATWADISGNGNDFTQSNASRQPDFSQSGLINGRPSVAFNGTTDFFSSSAIPALNTDVLSYFIVYRNQSILPSGNNFGMVLSTRSSINNIEWAYQLKRENNFTVAAERYARQITPLFAIASSSLTTSESLSSAIANGIWRGADAIYGQWNGAKTATTSGANSSGFTHVFTNLGAALDASNNPIRLFTGDVSEVIIFNNEINSAQEKIIYNHLSAKYNVTLGGSIIYAHNATHPNEVAGIGRDNVSNQHLSAKGSGIVEFTAASLSDGNYLLWGHNDDVLTSQSTDVPISYNTTFGERMTRTWKVSETGSTGNVTISFDLVGNHFGHPNDYELLIDADGDFTSGTTIIAGTLVGDIVSFTVTGAQLNDGDFFTVANSNVSVIRSIVSGQNWNQTSTWSCSCIPLITDYVTISDNHIVNLTDIQNTARLTVRSNGELSIASSGLLNITEHINVIGTINSDPAGTINFIGSALQTVNTNGTINFGSLTMNNSGVGAQLQTGNFFLSGVLTLTDGDLDLGGNQFTFTSSASGTAAIGVLTGAATILNSGNARVQRFIPTGVAGYRNIGTPQTNMPLEEWDNELFISGPGFPDGCAFSSNGCYRSARLWDVSTQQYVGIDNISTLIPNGTGVEIWLGDNLTSFNQSTLTSSGEINMDLSTNINIGNGWNLIANPFMSSINFHNVIRNNVSIGNYFYVFNPDNNAFEWYDAASSTSSSNWTNGGVLSSFQGFWVFNNGVASSMTFNQASKSFGVDGFFKNEHSNQLVVKLIENGKEEGAACVIELNNDASYGFDENLDMPAFPYQIRLSNQIYSKSVDDQSLVFNSRPEESNCIKIPLFLDVADENSFKIQFDKLPQGYACYMIDENTKTVSKINDNSIFYFDAQSGTEQNRYSVLLTKNTQECSLIEDDYATRFKVHTYQNTVFVALEGEITDFTVEIKNLLGQTVYHSKLYSETSNEQFVLDVNDGVYLVEIKSHSGNIISTSKVFINK